MDDNLSAEVFYSFTLKKMSLERIVKLTDLRNVSKARISTITPVKSHARTQLGVFDALTVNGHRVGYNCHAVLTIAGNLVKFGQS